MKHSKGLGFIAAVLTLAMSGCSDRTHYATNYDEKAFRGLPMGIQSNAAIELLGRPLGVSKQEYYERWCYLAGAPVTKRNGFTTTQWNPAPRLVLFFSEDGKVIDQFGGSLEAKGLSKPDVSIRYGQPDTKETNFFAMIFSYSESKTSESHHVRALIFDRNGVLIEKKAFYYRD